MPDETLRLRVGRRTIREAHSVADLAPILADVANTRLTRTVETDYSFDTLGQMLDPQEGLNPILTQITDQIAASGFDPTIAGHGKGSFSLSW